MYNPFWFIISKYFEKEKVPELKIEDYNGVDPHIQELESVRNKEIIRDDATSQRAKRRRQGVRRDSRNNSR